MEIRNKKYSILNVKPVELCSMYKKWRAKYEASAGTKYCILDDRLWVVLCLMLGRLAPITCYDPLFTCESVFCMLW